MCDKDNAATDGTNAACGPDFSSDMVSYEFDFDEDDIIEEIAPAESAAFGEAHKNHVKDCALNESVPDTAKSCGNDYEFKKCLLIGKCVF